MAKGTKAFHTNSTCGQCKCPIWKLSVNGIEVKLDIELLTLADELLARLENRSTYEIRKWNPNFYATYRSAQAISWSGSRQPLVLAAHKCHAPTTTEHPEYFPNPNAYVYTEEPKF